MKVTCSIAIRRPPARVFEVLCDATAYPRWVVGARKIRWVDAAWPEPGTSFYHELGAGPIRVRDKTTMVEHVQDRMVRLRAKAWPAGEADVTLTVEPAPDGSIVTLIEEPAQGMLSAVPSPVARPALYARNVVSLRRLKRLVERDRAGA